MKKETINGRNYCIITHRCGIKGMEEKAVATGAQLNLAMQIREKLALEKVTLVGNERERRTARKGFVGMGREQHFNKGDM